MTCHIRNGLGGLALGLALLGGDAVLASAATPTAVQQSRSTGKVATEGTSRSSAAAGATKSGSPRGVRAIATGRFDLAVTLRLNELCYIEAKVSNLGTAGLSDADYSAVALQFSRNGTSWGGWGLNTFDSQRALAKPGGVAVFVWKAVQLTGTNQIDVALTGDTALSQDLVTANNKDSGTFKCPVPDPSLTAVSFQDDCRPRLRLENANGPIPEEAYASSDYTGLFLERIFDGVPTGAPMTIGSVDGGQYRRLRMPGSVVDWVDRYTPAPTRSVEYRLRYSLTSPRPEVSVDNNVVSLQVPERCGPLQLKRPDLQPVNLRVSPSCQILVDLRNNGPGSLPLTNGKAEEYSINFSEGTKAKGGTSSQSTGEQLVAPGASATYVYPLWTLDSTPRSVTVRLDGSDSIAEQDENNNSLTRTLSCPAAK